MNEVWFKKHLHTTIDQECWKELRESFSSRVQLGIEATLQEIDSLRSHKEVNNPRVKNSLEIIWGLGIE